MITIREIKSIRDYKLQFRQDEDERWLYKLLAAVTLHKIPIENVREGLLLIENARGKITKHHKIIIITFETEAAALRAKKTLLNY